MGRPVSSTNDNWTDERLLIIHQSLRVSMVFAVLWRCFRSPRQGMDFGVARRSDGRTAYGRRPRGELARCRDEPQLLAILGTDRPTAPHRILSYFDVAQRDIKLYHLIHFLPLLPSMVGAAAAVAVGRQTTATCLFLMTRLLKGASSSVLHAATAVYLSDSRWGAILPRPHLPSIHPSIYPAVQYSGGGIAIKAAFNQQSVVPPLPPPPRTLACTLQK